jgi:hypothetical protein
MKKLIPYLVVNIIVSALTTLAVLFFWDRAQQADLNSPPPSAASPTLNAPAGTPLPAGTQLIQIDNVIGAGDLDNEVVMLKRVGAGELSLAGWKLTGTGGKSFIFPTVSLYEGSLMVYSKIGENSAIELFWGQTKAVWQSGSTVQLLDPSGALQDSYLIP